MKKYDRNKLRISLAWWTLYRCCGGVYTQTVNWMGEKGTEIQSYEQSWERSGLLKFSISFYRGRDRSILRTTILRKIASFPISPPPTHRALVVCRLISLACVSLLFCRDMPSTPNSIFFFLDIFVFFRYCRLTLTSSIPRHEGKMSRLEPKKKRTKNQINEDDGKTDENFIRHRIFVPSFFYVYCLTICRSKEKMYSFTTHLASFSSNPCLPI